jgi:transposase
MQEALDLGLLDDSESSAPEAGIRKPHVRRQVVFRTASEPELYPMDFSSMLSADCPAKFIRSVLSQLDLSEFRSSYKDFGGVSYPADSFLGVMLLAYFLGIRSSARIEEHCCFDIRFMYVGNGIKPDERTIRRFRRRLDTYADNLFKSVLSACIEEGLLTKRLVAVDGTKLASAASQLKRWFTEEEEEEINALGLSVPESSDPDSRILKSHSGYVRGYNCQAAVDCDSGIVVAIDVTQCSNDRPSLTPMVKKIIENLGEIPEKVVADTGYDSTEGLQTCADLEVDAIVAIEGQSPYFWTVTPDDEILCPMGEPATFVGETTDRGKPVQVLRVHGCRSCMFYGTCCSTRCGRTIKLPVGCNPSHRILAAYRARGPEGKMAMVERMATIEPVFADIKWNKKMTRFLLRGMKGVATEWTLMHTVRNLMILARAIEAIFVIIFARRRRNNPKFFARILSHAYLTQSMQLICINVGV